MTTSATPAHFRFREVAEPLQGATTVSIKDSALIVIDTQRFYLPDGSWPVDGVLETNKVIEALVERYQKVSAFVFFFWSCC
jgi:nicotinamidase-related amidase